MRPMTKEEQEKHQENPNVLLKIAGKPFYCECGCNVFHHKDDWDIFICNACQSEYETE